MRSTTKQMLHWTPRILAIVGIVFLGIFALDVFVEYETLGEVVLAFVMHLMPSIILLVITVIAWRWRIIGGILFLLIGFFSIFFFHTYEETVSFVILTLPPFIVGLLFLWEGLMTWVYGEMEADAS